MIYVLMCDGVEVVRGEDKPALMDTFVEETKGDFKSSVELLRVVATATRGVNITRSYRERAAKPQAKRGPRKGKNAEVAS